MLLAASIFHRTGTWKYHPKPPLHNEGSTQFHGMKIVRYLLRLVLHRALCLIIKKQVDPCRVDLLLNEALRPKNYFMGSSIVSTVAVSVVVSHVYVSTMGRK